MSEEQKPMEFTLVYCQDGTYQAFIYRKSHDQLVNSVHVIEFSAYEKLQQELAAEKTKSQKLVEALEFYADKNNWEYTPYDHDYNYRAYSTILKDNENNVGESGGEDYSGKTARQALAEYKAEK
jgi:hypothetical protein